MSSYISPLGILNFWSLLSARVTRFLNFVNRICFSLDLLLLLFFISLCNIHSTSIQSLSGISRLMNRFIRRLFDDAGPKWLGRWDFFHLLKESELLPFTFWGKLSKQRRGSREFWRGKCSLEYFDWRNSNLCSWNDRSAFYFICAKDKWIGDSRWGFFEWNQKFLRFVVSWKRK